LLDDQHGAALAQDHPAAVAVERQVGPRRVGAPAQLPGGDVRGHPETRHRRLGAAGQYDVVAAPAGRAGRERPRRAAPGAVAGEALAGAADAVADADEPLGRGREPGGRLPRVHHAGPLVVVLLEPALADVPAAAVVAEADAGAQRLE